MSNTLGQLAELVRASENRGKILMLGELSVDFMAAFGNKKELTAKDVLAILQAQADKLK